MTPKYIFVSKSCICRIYISFPWGKVTFNCIKSHIQTQSDKNILVSSTALQCKKVQFSIEKFHWSKKLQKTEQFSFNLNIRIALDSVNLFLHFLCLNVILTMKYYIKLLTIFI